MNCRLFAFAAISLTFAFGCGSKNPNAPANVRGKVLYNGKPVTGGTIFFHTAEQGTFSGGISPDGTYDLTDLVTGDMIVTVDTESINPDRKQQVYDGSTSKGSGKQAMYGNKTASGPKTGKVSEASPVPSDAPTSRVVYLKIPAKYSDKTQSNLKVTLSNGSNKNNFDLTD
jgi:hypothetical protein